MEDINMEIRTIINLTTSLISATLSLKFFNINGDSVSDFIMTGFSGSGKIRFWQGITPTDAHYICYYNAADLSVPIASELISSVNPFYSTPRVEPFNKWGVDNNPSNK